MRATDRAKDDRHDRSAGPDFDASGGAAARPGEVGGAPPQAWEMVGAGRYMPRRTRGSFPGRELG